jgi:hypothetical protein
LLVSPRRYDLAALRPVARVYIVENLQTGLAFEDCEGSVVFMGLGRGACSLAGRAPNSHYPADA